MLTEAQRERLHQIAGMTDKYQQSWDFFHFRDGLELEPLKALLQEPEVTETTEFQVSVEKDIKERIELEPKTAVLTDEWVAQYPNLAKLMTGMAPRIAFVRAMEFCNCDYNFLAQVTEEILRRHAAGEKKLALRRNAPHFMDMSDWNDRPRNRRCLTLSCISTYTQRAMNSFRHIFFPGLRRSGGGSDGNITFEW